MSEQTPVERGAEALWEFVNDDTQELEADGVDPMVIRRLETLAVFESIDRDGLARAWFEAGAQSAARQFGLNEPVQWKNLTQADVDCLLEQADAVIAWLTGSAS